MLPVTQTELPGPISDLAAGLTDLTLQRLSKEGIRGNSVEMELATWHVLTEEIERGFDLLQARSSPNRDFHLRGLIQQAMHNAVVRMADEFGLERSRSAIDAQMRPAAASPRLQEDTQAALERRAPQAGSNRSPSKRSDVVGRLPMGARN
jgi:hypothetical protein